jgi:hypothetical protein
MDIDIRGLTGDRSLETHVRDRMTVLLARFREAPPAAWVTFADVNGPKGGVDIECGLHVRLRFRPPVHVAHMGLTHRRAFDDAFAVLERQLERQIGRGRDRRRWPKKYYVAKQLFAAGGERAESRARPAT